MNRCSERCFGLVGQCLEILLRLARYSESQVDSIEQSSGRKIGPARCSEIQLGSSDRGLVGLFWLGLERCSNVQLASADFRSRFLLGFGWIQTLHTYTNPVDFEATKECINVAV